MNACLLQKNLPEIHTHKEMVFKNIVPITMNTTKDLSFE